MRWAASVLLLVACAPPGTQAAAAARARGQERTHAHPPLRGGSLLMLEGGRTAVVTDADRDAIWIVDVGAELSVRDRVDLEAEAEPWRLVEDGRGRVHVGLRGPGEVATIDPSRAVVVRRRSVCPTPAGLAWDPDEARVLVACEGGRVVALGARGVTTLERLAPDLRDVWIATGTVAVSRFRAAEARPLEGPAFAPPLTQLPVTRGTSRSATFAARVAWRTVPAPDGGAWMLHQRHRETPIPDPPRWVVGQAPYYGGEAPDGVDHGTIIKPALTYLEPDGAGVGIVLDEVGVLPVDVAPSPDGSRLVIAFAGHGGVVALSSPRCRGRDCARSGPEPLLTQTERALGVGWSGSRVVAQLADPPRLVLVDVDDGVLLSAVRLGTSPTRHAGRDVFHRATPTGLACASCHPEGGDDGFVWELQRDRPRRTMTLLGGVMDSAPFHWGGEHASLDALMSAVFVGRMDAEPATPSEVLALGEWLDARPADRVTPEDPGAARRGQRLFESPRTRCAECHYGPRLTDNRTHDVGTGGRFQTPTLRGLARRAPYFHNGCAALIDQRWDRCHSERHGAIDDLTPAERADLNAYLLSL